MTAFLTFFVCSSSTVCFFSLSLFSIFSPPNYCLITLFVSTKVFPFQSFAPLAKMNPQGLASDLISCRLGQPCLLGECALRQSWGRVKMASRKTLKGSSPNIAVCTVAIISFASAPKTLIPRMRLLPYQAAFFIKPRGSERVRVRSTSNILLIKNNILI